MSLRELQDIIVYLQTEVKRLDKEVKRLEKRLDTTKQAPMNVLRYGRVFNLGNYESERIEKELPFPDGTLDSDNLALLKEIVEGLHRKQKRECPQCGLQTKNGVE